MRLMFMLLVILIVAIVKNQLINYKKFIKNTIIRLTLSLFTIVVIMMTARKLVKQQKSKTNLKKCMI